MADLHDHGGAAGAQDVRRWAESGQLFAILDACDTPLVPERARQLGSERAVSLYRGSAEEEWEAIAPYLVLVDVALFDWIIGTLWPEPWGVFARSDVDLETLRTHFRRFLRVKSPEGEDWYFRFYDPRVLMRYLSSCTMAERSEFFGPISVFGCPSPGEPHVSLFSRDSVPTAIDRAPLRIRVKGQSGER